MSTLVLVIANYTITLSNVLVAHIITLSPGNAKQTRESLLSLKLLPRHHPDILQQASLPLVLLMNLTGMLKILFVPNVLLILLNITRLLQSANLALLIPNGISILKFVSRLVITVLLVSSGIRKVNNVSLSRFVNLMRSSIWKLVNAIKKDLKLEISVFALLKHLSGMTSLFHVNIVL